MGDTATWLAGRVASLIPNMLPAATAAASSSSGSSSSGGSGGSGGSGCTVAATFTCSGTCTTDGNALQKWSIIDTGQSCKRVMAGCCVSA